MKKEKTATWLLLLATVFFSGIYVFMREGVLLTNPYNFLFYRFLVASVIFFILFHKTIAKINKRTIRYGVYLGIPLTASLIFLALGLQRTTASKAGFIGGMYIIFVPILLIFITKKLPSWNQVIAIIIAMVGLGIITLNIQDFDIDIGDIWVLLFSLFLALYIVLVGKLAKKQNAVSLTFVQILFACLINFIIVMLSSNFEIPRHYLAWQAIIYVGIFGTVAYFIQNRYQRYISDIKVGLIYSLEPVFAALMAFVYLKETITLRLIIGGILIFISLIVTELKKGKD